MPRVGGKRKKTRTHSTGPPVGATVLDEVDEVKEDVPRSIVARASKVAPMVSELICDIRKMMNPHTASNLKERRSLIFYML
jgi:ribosome biogenesis protein SSF1/2